MKKATAPLTYTTPSGNPVVSQQYTLTEREVEAVEARDLIVAEGEYTVTQAGLLTLPVMVDPDPSFAEWLTCGVLTPVGGGLYAVADPAVETWIKAVIDTGRVW